MMIKDYLDEPGCLGVVRSVDGQLKRFRRHGVVDLLELVETEPEFLKGALLFALGGAGSVYARVISSGALKVLRDNNITVSFGAETPYIKNRKGDGLCPVETLTAHVNDPQEAFRLIKTFIETKNKEK